jgi:hypothetical protein
MLREKYGVLLLVEDCQMPIGEMAYQKGFLVLDTPEVKDLFQITEEDSGFCYSVQDKNRRLKLHRIPKNLLMRINSRSRIKAIESIAHTAQEQILAIRKEEKNYKNGKIHGFLTQQYANAMLNLAVFKGSN